MPKTCPHCNGVKRLPNPLRRSWWQKAFGYPEFEYRNCAACKGIGVIRGTEQEERAWDEEETAGLVERQRRQASASVDKLLKEMVRSRASGSGVAGKDEEMLRQRLLALGSAALEPIIQQLDNPEDWSTNQAAAKCLRWINNGAANTVLLSVMNPPRADLYAVGEHAIAALVSAGDQRAIAPIRRLINDKTLGKQALLGLKALGENLDAARDPDLAYSMGDFESLRGLGKQALPTLHRYLGNPRCAELVGEIGDPSSTELLLGLLDHADEFSTKEVAIGSLAKIGAPEALGPMLDVLLAADHKAFYLADSICMAVERIVRISGHTVAAETLRRLEELPAEVHLEYYTLDGGNCTILRSKDVGTDSIRRAANEEIRRRREALHGGA